MRLLILLLVASSALAETRLVPCARAERCDPPPTGTFCRTPPFDAPVTYGGEIKMPGDRPASTPGGDVYWMWMKAGEPSRPCTVQETGQSWIKGACAKRVGELLYLSARFKVEQVER